VRPGAQWCTLCYTDLRAAPAPRRLPADVLASGSKASVAESHGAAVTPVAASASRGKHARQDATDGVASRAVASPDVGADGDAAQDERLLGADAMLAQLAAESSKPLGGLAGRFDSTAARIGLMAGGMLGFAVLLFLVMVIIGSML